jgi:putative transposase
VRYQFVASLVGQFRVSSLCRVLQVSRSGFYAWKGREPSARQREDERLLKAIHHSFSRSRGTYGSPRVLRDLREQGFTCGRQRVARLMQQAGLKAAGRPRFRVTTDSKHALPIADNLLARDFVASKPDVKWASDITYLWTKEGWPGTPLRVLAVTLDLFSRRVVGWSMQTRLDRSLVINALESALGQRTPEAGLLHHSDRGSQYASAEFQGGLSERGIVCSMSRKGDCWDNAAHPQRGYPEFLWNA